MKKKQLNVFLHIFDAVNSLHILFLYCIELYITLFVLYNSFGIIS